MVINDWKPKLTVIHSERKQKEKEKLIVRVVRCPICSNEQLLTYTTLNLKTCTDCDFDIKL